MKKALFILIVFFVSYYPLKAQIKIWNGTVSNDWFNTANWTPAALPLSSDSIVITGAVPFNAVITAAGAVGRVLTFNGSSVNPMLTINTGAVLTLANSASHALVIKDGILLNNGTLHTSQTSSGSYNAFAAINMLSNGALQNYGTITGTGGINDGLRMSLATVENHGNMTFSGENGTRVATAEAYIRNYSGANLTINGTSKAVQYVAGDFINEGVANILFDVEIMGSESDWFLEVCSKTTFAGLVTVVSSGSLINKGLLIYSGPGTITNAEGIVKNIGSGTVVNQRLGVRDYANRKAIFDIVSSTNHEVTGIFTDTLLTNSAGTYTYWSNIFEPTIPVGVHTLYARIITYTPDCTYSVPFTFKKFGTRRYVSTTGAGDMRGDSWATASPNLQDMMNDAEEGDSIFVKAGVYKPLKDVNGVSSPANARTKAFFLKSNVTLLGGFAGTETEASQRNITTNKTIFSGDIDNNDTKDGDGITQIHSNIAGNNSYHVLVSAQGGSNTRLDGLYITAGNANTNTNFSYGGRTIYDNTGGGFVADISSMNVLNCFFLGNKSSSEGGAWFSERALVNISKTVFKGNSSGTGGALNIQTAGGIILKNSFLIDNSATSDGGAMSLRNDSTVLDNVLMLGNTSGLYGGAIESNGSTPIKINNSVLYGNVSHSIGGGAMYLSQSSAVQVKNSILWNNLEGTNPKTIKYIQSGSGTFANNIIQASGGSADWQSGTGTDLGGNYDKDPMFLNAADADGADNAFFTNDDGFSLNSCSPAINRGNNTLASAKDIIGLTRPVNTTVDMGAYEFNGVSTLPADPTNLQLSQNNIACGTTVNLTANCVAGTVNWFTQALGGTALGSAAVSPGITTTYYAECDLGSGCVSLNRPSIILVVIPVATPTNIAASTTYACTGNAISFTASCASGTITWYRTTGTVWTQMATGSPYNTTFNSAYSYGVACVESATCKSEQLNAPTINRVVNPTSVSKNKTSVCSGGELILTATCTGGNLRWFTVSSNGSEIGQGSPLSVFPTSTTNYYAECFGDGSCKSSRVSTGSVTIDTQPAAPTSVAVDDASVCAATTINLSAVCATGTLNWFRQAVGGTSFGTGTPLSTVIDTTTTFYAACVNGGCESPRQSTVQVVVSNVSSNLSLSGPITGNQQLLSSNTIVSDGIVSNTAVILLKANNSITLLPLNGSGFKIESGAVFEAKIESVSSCQ